MANKPIKLFVDAHSFDSGFQGTQTFIRELYATLLNTCPELDIYFGVQDAEKIKAAFPSVKPENILLYKKRWAGLLRFVFDIPALIKKHRFDYAHFQYLSPLKQAGCKYIVTTHDVLFNDFPADFSFAYRESRNFLFGRSIQNADIKTTVSAYSQQRIAHHYNIPANDIKVIPNGVSKPAILKKNAQAIILKAYGIQNFILYVSRVEPRKNHALLLRKYLKLELYQKNIPLVFIGQETELVEELILMLKNLSPEKKAMFHWFKSVEQVHLDAFYSACRLFVYPSKAEGFGIPPLEAAVCRVPVLCSSATAMGDFYFFEPYTFDPENGTDLEFQLEAMLNNPPPEETLRHIAETVSAKYCWQQSADYFHSQLVIGLRDKPMINAINNPSSYLTSSLPINTHTL